MIIRISSLNHPDLAPYTCLTGAQLRAKQSPEDALVIAESVPVIESALERGLEPVSALMPERHVAGKAAPLAAKLNGIPVFTADDDLLAGLTGYRLTRGVLCAFRRPAPMRAADICVGARRIAVLEDVADQTNLGAIFRSAAALGMDAVTLSPGCCDPYCRRSVRVSMGAVFRVPFAYLADRGEDWPQRGLARLREMGFTPVATALSDRSVSLNDYVPPAGARLALFLGNEGSGLRRETVGLCDVALRIPMAHGVDSLNVAAAAAVVFWALNTAQAAGPGGSGVFPAG